ncbi:uncharacterized protein LOC112596634 [Melanaphis sacchari]|uniref:uncharacterized protein LOC112596634 n=1 Tax=Melanaphis sacchari TaxID=742174 RepID=UPI000DC13076|nr:uncharacterized protein LOC112596634 [Melanaphis sacchari]
MRSARKKSKLSANDEKLWELNLCVICSSTLSHTSKFLHCLHGVCNKCFDFNETLPDKENFLCKCGVETNISNGLINCTFSCEEFNESVLRDNYVDQIFQKAVYGLYRTKTPCSNSYCKGGKFIEIYCVTCNQFQCSFCQLIFHRSHEFKDIEIVMEEIRERLMKSKYSFYLNFSESVLKDKNMVDLDMTNLTNNQMLTVRENFMLDTNVKPVTLCISRELKTTIDIIMSELKKSIIRIGYAEPLYQNSISNHLKISKVSILPNYQSTTSKDAFGSVELNLIFITLFCSKILVNRINNVKSPPKNGMN